MAQLSPQHPSAQQGAMQFSAQLLLQQPSAQHVSAQQSSSSIFVIIPSNLLISSYSLKADLSNKIYDLTGHARYEVLQMAVANRNIVEEKMVIADISEATT